MLPIFSRYWSCVEDDPTISTCPGRFSLECPNTLSSPLNSDLCETENQLIINDDCTEGFFCQKNAEYGGFYRKCEEEGKTIDVNIRNWNWGCLESRNNCPGLGGFRVGGTGNINPPELICSGYSTLPEELGVCTGCDNQVFINHDCSYGFICSKDIPQIELDKGSQGCFHECAEGTILVPDFSAGSYQCVPDTEAICPGRFQTFCAFDPVPDTVDESDCECDNEFLVTPDCKQVFLCDKRADGGGYSVSCDEPGEIIQVNLDNWNVGCQEDTEPSKCPSLGGGFIIGCAEDPNEIPLFCDDYGNNNLGECGGCDGQVFMNDNCSQGFICTSNLPVSTGEEGCMKSCPSGTILVPDFANERWQCLDPFEGQCLGGLTMYCQDEDIGNNFSDSDCSCKEELILSADCKEAFRCSADGGKKGLFDYYSGSSKQY